MNPLNLVFSDIGCYYRDDIPPEERSFHRSFGELLGKTDAPLELDATALTEFVSNRGFVGNKTIVKHIRRTPFLCDFDDKSRTFSRLPAIPYGIHSGNPEAIAEALGAALRREIRALTEGKHKVGILLSGGMDSRVLASFLKSAQNEGSAIEVTAFNWGNPRSRDVVYCKRMAELYQWPCEHFDITPRGMVDNIKICADEGCFYSPENLHAMNQVGLRALGLGTEVMLAGSYGDSMGRGEYSGIAVSRLPQYRRRFRNWFHLMAPDLERSGRRQTLYDLAEQHRDGGYEGGGCLEVDYQMNCMRNILGTCMGVIGRSVPLRQAFTHYDTVGAVWQYEPQCRTDHVYYKLLQKQDARLLEIPWARTGQPYLRDDVPPDNLDKEFNDYYLWALYEVYDDIAALAFSGEVDKLGVFDLRHLEWILGDLKRSRRRNSRIVALFLWLASLALFIRDREVVFPVSEAKWARVNLLGRLEYEIYRRIKR